MKSVWKKSLAVALLLVGTQAFADTQPCPSIASIQEHATILDSVQAMMYDTYLVLSGTLGELETSYYDEETNRNWRIFTVTSVAHNDKLSPQFNAAYKAGVKSVQNITERKSDLAQEIDQYYVCDYSIKSGDSKVGAFSMKENAQPGDYSRFIMKMVKRVK